MLLAQDDVDVNSRDEYGQTTLSPAAKWGYFEGSRGDTAVDVDSKDGYIWSKGERTGTT